MSTKLRGGDSVNCLHEGAHVTRRAFTVGGVAAGISMLGASSVALATEGAQDGPAADESGEGAPAAEVDLLVIGSGMAGTCAAIQAAEDGLSVLVIEKRDIAGGASLMSDGLVMASPTKIAQDQGVNFSAHAFYRYLAEELDPAAASDRDIQHAFAYGSAAGARFLERQGVAFLGVESVREGMPACTLSTDGGAAVMTRLHERLAELGVEIRTGCAALELVRDEKGGVCGARVSDGEAEETVGARAVLLATGGFSASPEMMVLHASPLLAGTSSYNANTGDGYEMARAAGAAMLDTDVTITTSSEVFSPSWLGAFQPELFYVNGEGNRYCDESISVFDRVYELLSSGSDVEYAILDEEQRQTYADVFDVAPEGSVYEGDDPRTLADALGIDADAFATTIERYNELCDAGEDVDFGKDARYLKRLEGRLYALRMSFDTSDTLSGPRINRNAQVLDASGCAIRGLYAAGAVSMAQLAGHAYPGSGASLMSGCVFGRAAARHVRTLIDLGLL